MCMVYIHLQKLTYVRWKYGRFHHCKICVPNKYIYIIVFLFLGMVIPTIKKNSVESDYYYYHKALKNRDSLIVKVKQIIYFSD